MSPVGSKLCAFTECMAGQGEKGKEKEGRCLAEKKHFPCPAGKSQIYEASVSIRTGLRAMRRAVSPLTSLTPAGPCLPLRPRRVGAALWPTTSFCLSVVKCKVDPFSWPFLLSPPRRR